MRELSDLKKPFIFFLALFFIAAPVRAWDGGETRMEGLAGELRLFIERIGEHYMAGPAVREELGELIAKYSDAECSSDFPGFLAALEGLAAKTEENVSMYPDAIIEFRQIFEDDLKMGCPAGMVLIEGIYCIDRHEYPGKTGDAPQGGWAWNEAVAKCAEQGKYLCGGAEWRRACRGNTACSDTLFGEDFGSGKCGVLPQYVAPGADWRLADRPECQSAYGVDDLAGGLWEWTTDDYRQDLKVLWSGASPKDPMPSCDETMWAEPAARMEYAGFRCCAPPTPPEETREEGTAAAESPAAGEETSTETDVAAVGAQPETATGTAVITE